MKLEINGTTYQVPREYEQKIFDQLWNKEAVPWYENLNEGWKIAGMVLSRLVIAWMEQKIFQETGDKEKARSIRPPKKGMDPNLWAGEKLALILFEGMNYVTIACETGVDAETGEKQILAFNLQIDAARAETSLALSENTNQAGG